MANFDPNRDYIKGTISTNAMLVTLQTLGVFGLIYAMTGGGPGTSTTTLPIFMWPDYCRLCIRVRLRLKLDAGEIRLNRVSGKMQLETDAGEIEVQGISLENDLSARTDVGEIKIHLNESPKAAGVDLKSDLGEVTADLEDVQYSVSSTNETIGSNGPRLDANTGVGAILVNTK